MELKKVLEKNAEITDFVTDKTLSVLKSKTYTSGTKIKYGDKILYCLLRTENKLSNIIAKIINFPEEEIDDICKKYKLSFPQTTNPTLPSIEPIQ